MKIEMKGKKYGLWLVLSEGPRSEKGNIRWWCRCECGKKKLVLGSSIRAGSSRSCGCQHGPKDRHMASHSEEYGIFAGAKYRCENKKNTSYHKYGGRGIRFEFLCFEDFLAELGPRPSKNHSLDRINNHDHYRPGNVRWATAKEQARNTRTNCLKTICGVTKTKTEWAETIGITQASITNRISRGWCDRCAWTAPPKSSCNHV